MVAKRIFFALTLAVIVAVSTTFAQAQSTDAYPFLSATGGPGALSFKNSPATPI